MRHALGALALAGGLALGSLVVSAAPAAAEPAACDTVEVDTSPDDVDDVDDAGPPLEQLQIRSAQAKVVELTGRQPGEGVGIAVLDSGVIGDDVLVPTSAAVDTDKALGTALEYYHGTAVAGLINGQDLPGEVPVGIAPAATVVDVRVYDVGPDGADEDSAEVSSEGIVQGLEAIRPRVADGEIDIVTIALSVPGSDALTAAVRRITGAGAIVVASSGNRSDRTPEFAPGEDFAGEVFPAGITDDPLVVAASTLPREGVAASEYILQSSAIDVAVPTADAVTYALNGSGCTFGEPSTSAAAAEVSGVLALLMTVHPDVDRALLVRQLEITATGSPDDDPVRRDKLTGHGVVQPLEAVSRPLVRGTGPLEAPRGDDRARPVRLPEREPDVLASTRDNAVWWGLIGGGALVVAVLLRPVLSRRR